MYKTQFLKLSLIHTIFGTDEVAQTACHIVDPAAAVVNAATILSTWTVANLTTIATAWNAFYTSGALRCADYSAFSAVKLAACGTDGDYVADPLIYEVPFGTLGGSFANVPPQDSVVMSLRTSTSFGTANFGRMYVPHTIMPLVTGTPYVASADAASACTNFVTFIHAVNTIASGHAAGDVISNMSQKGSGTTKAVTRVACGRVIDTQRRRRNRLEEGYSFANV